MSADHELPFESIDEPTPGDAWRARFEAYWDAYRRWYAIEGDGARPSYADCRRALREHMPELVPAWEALVDLAGGGDLAARFLSLYDPPPYLAGCAQAAWRRGDESALVRNYDYAPRLCDGIVLRSAWTGTTAIATTDCLVGALDGVNERGLAAALAFGGRKTRGRGFGIAMAVRYLIETCGTVDEAVAALVRVPVHMSYTVVLVDASGEHATVFVGPDRAAVATRGRCSTNHQERVEWPAHAARTATVARAETLETILADPSTTLESLVAAFLEPPLHQRDWLHGAGTIYTVELRPDLGTATYRWPEPIADGDPAWHFALDRFDERSRVLEFGDGMW